MRPRVIALSTIDENIAPPLKIGVFEAKVRFHADSLSSLIMAVAGFCDSVLFPDLRVELSVLFPLDSKRVQVVPPFQFPIILAGRTICPVGFPLFDRTSLFFCFKIPPLLLAPSLFLIRPLRRKCFANDVQSQI